MAQDRMLRASLRTSEKANGWPIPLRYFWTQLWGYCDDYGRGRYDARLIVADTFPMDDEVTAQVVGRWMQALEMAGVIRVYEVDGKRYFECVNWHEHQELTYFRKTDLPDVSGEIPKPSKRSQKVLESSGSFSPKRRGREVEVEGEGKAETAPPPVDNSPFCSKHPKGTDTACRACGNARRAFEAARDTAKNAPTPAPPKGKPSPDTCAHKFVAGWCVMGCDMAEPMAGAS